jgi:hypothetical protein
MKPIWFRFKMIQKYRQLSVEMALSIFLALLMAHDQKLKYGKLILLVMLFSHGYLILLRMV